MLRRFLSPHDPGTTSVPAPGADVDPSSPPASTPPPVAAGWTEKEPEQPWLPEALREVMPSLATHAYAHADAVRATGAAWEATGATRRGRVHAHAGDFREDAMAVHVADDLVVAVVSDGAGSARWSRVGAEATCRAVVDAAVAAWPALAAAPGDALDAGLGAALGDGVVRAATTLREAATAAGGQSRDFRCTVVALAWGRAQGREAMVLVQVGDGIAAVRRTDGAVERPAAGDSGDFSGEVTCFVPDDGCEGFARRVVALDAATVDAVLVATDGIEDPFYPIARRGADVFRQLAEGNDATLDGFVRQPAHGPVVGHADGAAHLATWLGFEKRGENDDRTIVVLARRAGSAGS